MHKDDVFEESCGRASLLTGSVIPKVANSKKIEKKNMGLRKQSQIFGPPYREKTEHEVATQDWNYA